MDTRASGPSHTRRQPKRRMEGSDVLPPAIHAMGTAGDVLGSAHALRALGLLQKTRAPDEVLDQALLHARLARALQRLPSQQRTTLVLRFGLAGSPPATLEEIATAMNLSRERARQLEAAALYNLRKPIRLLGLLGFAADPGGTKRRVAALQEACDEWRKAQRVRNHERLVRTTLAIILPHVSPRDREICRLAFGLTGPAAETSQVAERYQIPPATVQSLLERIQRDLRYSPRELRQRRYPPTSASAPPPTIHPRPPARRWWTRIGTLIRSVLHG